jgi:hypothetical protein
MPPRLRRVLSSQRQLRRGSGGVRSRRAVQRHRPRGQRRQPNDGRCGSGCGGGSAGSRSGLSIFLKKIIFYIGPPK